jgi:2-furoyl-CoA dehydrogenase large subunit
VSATNRLITLQAAVAADGRVTALAWDQVEDVGRTSARRSPATLYRMHGNLTGAYDIRNVSVRNRVVMTNKTPTGLNRGFGGPQVYYALERLMQRVAVELELDPLDVIRRNLCAWSRFRTAPPTGGLLGLGRLSGSVWSRRSSKRPCELRARADSGARRGSVLYGIRAVRVGGA